MEKGLKCHRIKEKKWSGKLLVKFDDAFNVEKKEKKCTKCAANSSPAPQWIMD